MSQRHSPSWCPTIRLTLTAPCHKLFTMSDGPLPDMLWLLAPSVLFHPGQCQSFLPIYFRFSDVPALDGEMRGRDTLPPCRLVSRSPGVSCSPYPHTRSHFFFQPSGFHVPHASGDTRDGRGWAPFPETCPDPCPHSHSHHSHHRFWNPCR